MGSGHETSWHLATQNHKYVVGKGASLSPFVCKAKMELFFKRVIMLSRIENKAEYS